MNLNCGGEHWKPVIHKVHPSIHPSIPLKTLKPMLSPNTWQIPNQKQKPALNPSLLMSSNYNALSNNPDDPIIHSTQRTSKWSYIHDTKPACAKRTWAFSASSPGGLSARTCVCRCASQENRGDWGCVITIACIRSRNGDIRSEEKQHPRF